MYTAGARVLQPPVTEMTDEDLVRQFQDGDRDAFRRLVERNEDRVRSVILYTVNRKDMVDDIAQEVFVKVYRGLPTFRFESRFYTWVYRITINTCRDELRKIRWKRFISFGSGSNDAAVNAVRGLQTHNRYDNFDDVVQWGLRQLPVRYREIIVLKDIEDKSYEEIAEVLSCEMGTVKSRLSRARAALRKVLQPYEEEFK
jgi:RNA polymerase sigma-70 factor, ECF subfamily